MPPKAKIRLRRPAARADVRLRRPAAAEGDGDPPGAIKSYLSDLSMAELAKLKHICVKRGLYYHREVEGLRVADGNIFIDLEASGTKDDRLLKVLTSRSGRRVSHTCPPGCGQNLTDESLIHARECEQVQPTQEPWFTNLLKVRDEGAAHEDELEVLRVEAADRAKERKERRREESPKTKKATSKRKKEDKDKEAKGEKNEKKAEESSGSEMVEVGQKPLADLFSGTSRSSCCDGFDGSQAVPHDGMRAALGCGAEVTSSTGNPILPATPSSRDVATVATYAARGRHGRSMP